MVQGKIKSTLKAAETQEERKVNESDEYSSCDDSDKKKPIAKEEDLESGPDDKSRTRRRSRRLRSRSHRRVSRRRSRSKRRRR